MIAVGGYHIPKQPKLAERLPGHLVQLHSSAYRNPQSLPDGAALVVGTGQSGCQIAEDLHLAGRQVHLCVGSAPRSPHRDRGKDVVDWLDQMGYYDLSIDQHPQKEKVRTKANSDLAPFLISPVWQRLEHNFKPILCSNICTDSDLPE